MKMTKEEIIDGLYRGDSRAIKEAIKTLEQQPNDCVNRAEVFEIMGNLMSIPYDFDRRITEKDVSESMDEIRALPPVTPTQCIAAVRFSKEDLREICNERIEIKCTHGTCKDCKHWKDSDGVYRRGIGAESKCPINNSMIFEGIFYCAAFEK